MARKLKVFCLEGNWQDDLTEKDSLEPLLQLLTCHGELDYIRRDVATKAELVFYIKQWARRKYNEYDFGYFAFHGSDGQAIKLSDGTKLSLNAFANLLGNAASRKVVHIASCHGLKVSQRQLDSFLDKTKALAVCGYTEEVDTLDAAALELLLMGELRGNWRDPEARFRRLHRSFGDLVERTGFVWAL